MKKTIICILLLISVFIIYLINSNNKNYLVEIESISDNEITNGNGVVYKKENSDYYILTLYHIIANSNEIYVYSNGIKEKANLLYFDDYSDIAILTTKSNNLKVKKLNKCSCKINQNVTLVSINGKKTGTIKDLDFIVDVINKYGNSRYKSIVIAAPIELGDSGGIVMDKDKDIIGIISVMDEEYGYAIPICDAINIATKLEKSELNRPHLGAIFKNSETDIKGVLVYENKDYPYSFEENSIITKINNVSVNNISEFRNELYKYAIGDSVTFEYYYDGAFHTKSIILK